MTEYKWCADGKESSNMKRETWPNLVKQHPVNIWLTVKDIAVSISIVAFVLFVVSKAS